MDKQSTTTQKSTVHPHIDRISAVPLWEGAYYQGAREPMKFEYFKIDSRGIVRGEGKDIVGNFTLSGMLLKTPTSDIQFVKRYHGMHSVLYCGQYNPENGWFEGFWEIYVGNWGMADRFELLPATTTNSPAVKCTLA